MNGQNRADIKVGAKVKIVLKADQRTGKLTEGVVARLLTKSSFHPHGIKVQLEDGTTSTREIVHHHGGACILPVDADGSVTMVRQFRYAFGEEIWELPAGKLEANEDPFEAAKRELSEECGLTADNFIDLGVVYATVGYDSEKIYLWAATGLHSTAQHLDAGEFLDVVKMPFDEALGLVMDGTIKDSKTQVALLKYAQLRAKV